MGPREFRVGGNGPAKTFHRLGQLPLLGQFDTLLIQFAG
jgi:hypothetical protein